MIPLVSIIIPAFNSEKFLAECIDSAIGQTWPNKEIIVIDDGSTDGSLKIAQAYAGLKVISQNNKGASAARNAGLKEAKGAYLQFLDADDLLSPDKIEAQIACLNGSVTELAICTTVHFNNGENYLNGKPARAWFDADNANPVDFLTKLYAGEETMPGYGGMIAVHAWLTPVNLIEKAGPWNEKLSLDDDGEFFCRVVLASEGIKYSNKGFNYYRKFNRQQSLSAQNSSKSLESAILAMSLKFEHLKSKTNNVLVDRIFSRHFWWTGVIAYPQFKKLSGYCIKKAKALGYDGEKYNGGPAGHLLAKFTGWKIARKIAYYKQMLGKSWA
jgi:glycosyltransferase involved in cell wall biosynthesis